MVNNNIFIQKPNSHRAEIIYFPLKTGVGTVFLFLVLLPTVAVLFPSILAQLRYLVARVSLASACLFLVDRAACIDLGGGADQTGLAAGSASDFLFFLAPVENAESRWRHVASETRRKTVGSAQIFQFYARVAWVTTLMCAW
jgi:hypothetical protein